MSFGKQSVALTATSLPAFFHSALEAAIDHQKVDADDATLWYLTQLLSDFSRAERLFDQTAEGVTLTPLAELYRQATETRDATERRLLLRRLGDVALFISGLYSGLFTRRRRLVDVDYYVAMGGSAYGCLGEGSAAADRSLSEVFRRLSRHFVHFVDVIAEVGEGAFSNREHDLLRLHSLWQKTGSPRLQRKLVEAGVAPGAGGRRH